MPRSLPAPAFCIHRPWDAIQDEISLSWAGSFSPILFSLWQFHVITYIQDILAFAPSIVCAKYASQGKLLYLYCCLTSTYLFHR